MKQKTMQELKNEAMSTLQEYFPNGGRDWDNVTAVIDAIAEGKIPNVTMFTNSTFESAVEPAIKWLNDNVHPHHTIVITSTDAELLEGQQTHRTEKFLKD
ncbi:hypothetical protein [Budvicia aquatica]|uniref:Uncharacterized protein n=1 Tax=Budvicia aquatica TaxID=82979 RepID=A0A2C6DPM9_9GAMM|nr:hypothetical protein [Budvicia aquatica]PHI31177.1 hypothetical protein CRN84_18440 [Budvicia aquatica]VFS51437.1 Uncharacterised protein [Budvicia aquatica]